MNSDKMLKTPADDAGGKVLVVHLGSEGSGARIYGRHIDNAWLFWHEGSSWDIDDDTWSHYRSEQVQELEEALPSWWMNACPMEINPSFIPWFKGRYEQLCKSDPESPDDFYCSDRGRWLEILYENRKTQPSEL
ncbi:MAG: hypothetical protein Q8L79_07640 [Methylobacter sp.]|uniref:hypothetical protein n=1 Tax=Methylobacter sp. TaxID=2051955 RepID=UPI00273123AF|nr:hypothetical protein [Methylobacter sp.]MDP1664985.1 hypothetical protein [Methylobacter sp.]